MAIINGQTNTVYIHVTDENVDDNNEVSSHPVEDGIPITDTTKRNPVTVSLSGKIVNYPTTELQTVVVGGTAELPLYDNGMVNVTRKASVVLSMLKAMKNSGELITYQGRNIFYNMQITSLSTTHPNTNWGGCDFSMTLQECRIAKNAYVEPTVKDNNVKDGGTQQVEKGENKEVYYTTKQGDTIWYLIWRKKDGSRADYRDLIREGAAKDDWQANANWVMERNKHAFSRPMDDTTMQVDKKILLGVRE